LASPWPVNVTGRLRVSAGYGVRCDRGVLSRSDPVSRSSRGTLVVDGVGFPPPSGSTRCRPSKTQRRVIHGCLPKGVIFLQTPPIGPVF